MSKKQEYKIKNRLQNKTINIFTQSIPETTIRKRMKEFNINKTKNSTTGGSQVKVPQINNQVQTVIKQSILKVKIRNLKTQNN